MKVLHGASKLQALTQLLSVLWNIPSLAPAFLSFAFIFIFGIFTFQRSGQTGGPGSSRLCLTNFLQGEELCVCVLLFICFLFFVFF